MGVGFSRVDDAVAPHPAMSLITPRCHQRTEAVEMCSIGHPSSTSEFKPDQLALTCRALGTHPSRPSHLAAALGQRCSAPRSRSSLSGQAVFGGGLCYTVQYPHVPDLGRTDSSISESGNTLSLPCRAGLVASCPRPKSLFLAAAQGQQTRRRQQQQAASPASADRDLISARSRAGMKWRLSFPRADGAGRRMTCL